MKKFLATALTLLLVSLLGTTLAQGLATAEGTATHDVVVTIPEVLFVQILGTEPTVTFDYGTNATAYLTAADDETALPATSTMTDVQVWANMGWALRVEADEFSDAGSLSIANIAVNPSGDISDTPIATRMASFRLDEIGNVATGTATEGWLSVGISGEDYELFVDGSEAQGTHTTTVTYTIFSN